MPEYADAGHRPHAIHTGEEPLNEWTRGPYGITVTLDTWGPQEGLFTSMYDALQANWGEEPSRSVAQRVRDEYMRDLGAGVVNTSDLVTGWCRLTDGQRAYVESCFAGKTLPQVRELISFGFCIDGVSRAFTHQNVRTRIGAGFMQHGGRDNDWRHRKWTMPETIWRACEAHTARENNREDEPLVEGGVTLKHCITDWDPIDKLLDNSVMHSCSLSELIREYLWEGRLLYSSLVDAGIPWQDARRVLWMGTQTYIHDIYNYEAIAGMLARRLEHVMDWEINAVAQLMVREIRMKCHPLLGKYLVSMSDRLGKAAFAGLESWPTDGKYPNPHERCKQCGHAKGNHVAHPYYTEENSASPSTVCEVCERERLVTCYHEYEAEDTLPRQHRAEQMPFWVLHPDSMAGGEIRWIPTNGTYPEHISEATIS